MFQGLTDWHFILSLRKKKKEVAIDSSCHQRKFAGDSQQKYIDGLLTSNK